MNLLKDELYFLGISALVHDIGKNMIPQNVLNKPGPLTEKEFDIIKLHPVYGADYLRTNKYDSRIISAVLHHHERWDGRGYPDGLKGNGIPFLSRIISVADSFDAMTARRPYHDPVSIVDAVKEIEENSGTQFDPYIVTGFIESLRHGGI